MVYTPLNWGILHSTGPSSDHQATKICGFLQSPHGLMLKYHTPPVLVITIFGAEKTIPSAGKNGIVLTT
jgi:hypothetical protein